MDYNLAKVRVYQSEVDPTSWRVWLNEKEITHQVRSVQLNLDMEAITTVFIEFVVDAVDGPPREVDGDSS